jgi:hypothetical protein
MNMEAKPQLEPSMQESGSAMERKSELTIAIATALLVVLGATVIYAQDHA